MASNSGKMFANYEYDQVSNDLASRQKLLDKLKMRQMQGIAAPASGKSGPYEVAAQISPMQVLAELLTSYQVKKGQEGLAQEKSDFTRNSNELLKSDLGNFFEQQKAGDKQGALLAALSSQHPFVRTLAASQMEAGAKTGKPFEKVSQGDILVNPDTLELVKINAPTGNGNAVSMKTVGGDLYGESASGTGYKKLDNAPKISTNVTVSPVIQGQKAGYEKTFENNATVVKELGEQARQASNTAQSLEELDKLRKSGTFTNVTTGPVTWASNLAQVVGAKVDENKLANTETYNAEINKVHQSLIAQMEGGNRGVTKEEADEIKKQLPLAAHSPQAQERISSILRTGAQRKIQQYKTANRAHNQSLQAQDPSVFSDQFEAVNFPAPNSTTQDPEQKVRRYNPVTGKIE